MERHRLTKEERIKAVQYYYKTENASETARLIANEFNRPVPRRQSIAELIQKFEDTGSIADQQRSGRPSTVKSPDLQRRIQACLVPREPTSTRRLAQQLSADGDNAISHMTIQRALKKMGLHVYRPILLHALHEDDHDRRLEFCQLFKGMHTDDPNFINRIIWSDEASFKLNGHINKHNCIYYDVTNPHIIIEQEVNLPGVIVWAGVWSGGIIGPYFFPGTVSGQTYLDMLTDFLWPVVQQLPEEDAGFYFQQDGACPHYSLIVRAWLDNHFPDKWIGRRGPIDWPPRSPDLTVPDFFLWGVLKDKVYGRNPRNINDLKIAITEEMQAISPELVQKVCRSVPGRYQKCIDNNGYHFEHL